jgi:hypothetical protein
MTPIRQPSEVLDATQAAKAGASAYCTNLFADQKKLQDWIAHTELLGEVREGAALFLRKDRDFWHLHFAAANEKALQQAMAASPMLRTERVVADLVGDELKISGLLEAFEAAGFRRYNRLYRMARVAETIPETVASEETIGLAKPSDAPAILELLNQTFDPLAEQLPMLHEIEAAAASQQVFSATADNRLAAFLWFETQGFTSTIRYWLVAAPYRTRRLGAALMHHYFALHQAVRRFILWVVADNENAIAKYQHYGFRADGLAVHVLGNSKIFP